VPDDGFKFEFNNEQLRDYLDYRRDRDVLGQEAPPESEFKDTQLAKALDYLKQEISGNKPQTTDKAEDKKDEKAEPAKASKAAAQLNRTPLKVAKQAVL
jgi:hypothetical protein